jgi:PAS domain S-box-containing protein
MSSSVLNASRVFGLDHRRCRAAFERGAARAAITELEGSFVDANPAFCALVDRDRASIIGRRPEDFIVEYSGGGFVQIADLFRGAQDRVSGEASIRRGDGSLGWVMLSAARIRDSAGRADFFSTGSSTHGR